MAADPPTIFRELRQHAALLKAGVITRPVWYHRVLATLRERWPSEAARSEARARELHTRRQQSRTSTPTTSTTRAASAPGARPSSRPDAPAGRS